MHRFALLGALVSLVSCTAACSASTMQVVQETPSGGTVAVQGDGRDKAEQYMGSQCPFGYEIVGQQKSPDDQQTIRYACRLPTQPDDADAKRREAKEVAVHI